MAYDKSKWKEQAVENQKKAHDMIHEIGKNYTRSPEQIAEILEFNSKFYKYSLKNTKLIYTQNPNAVYVQSFEAWKKMDAHVKRGEKGIKIFVPVKVTLIELDDDVMIPLSEATKEQKDLYKAGMLESKSSIRFKIGNVFDISQTDYPVEKYPELFSVGFSSEEHKKINDGLLDFCEKMGVRVSFEKIASISLKGFYAPNTNRIVINENLNDTHRLSTLSHEIGHMLEKHGERDISKAQQEFEADSISILIQSYFGLELTEARKAHLADHYREFEAEFSDLSEEERISKVDEALSASMAVFRTYIDKIQGFVEKQMVSEEEKESVLETLATDIARYTFTVTECSEFPEMGNIYSEIPTAEAALTLYKNIPEYKRNMIPGISLVIEQPGAEIYNTKIPLFTGDTIDLSMLEYYPEMKTDKNAISKTLNFVDIAKKEGYKTYGEFPYIEQKNKFVRGR